MVLFPLVTSMYAKLSNPACLAWSLAEGYKSDTHLLICLLAKIGTSILLYIKVA